MARKFQMGDTVQVMKALGHTGLGVGFKIGHRGVVESYSSGNEYPYCVTRKNGNHNQFKAQELKLIRKGTK